jgi:hypothetical protein
MHIYFNGTNKNKSSQISKYEIHYIFNTPIIDKSKSKILIKQTCLL